MEKEENFPQTTSDAVDESTVPETPGATIVSPNETGTLIKNPASCDPTPQFKGTKKRLVSCTVYVHLNVLFWIFEHQVVGKM